MPSALTHQLAAFAAGTVFAANEEAKLRRQTVAPLAAGGAAAVLTRLPDILEPALHPNHRQFFHSVVFAAGLSYGVYRLYQLKPTEDWQKALRLLLLLAGGAYLVHLALDALTVKSLPLVGKIG